MNSFTRIIRSCKYIPGTGFSQSTFAVMPMFFSLYEFVLYKKKHNSHPHPVLSWHWNGGLYRQHCMFWISVFLPTTFWFKKTPGHLYNASQTTFSIWEPTQMKMAWCGWVVTIGEFQHRPWMLWRIVPFLQTRRQKNRKPDGILSFCNDGCWEKTGWDGNKLKHLQTGGGGLCYFCIFLLGIMPNSWVLDRFFWGSMLISWFFYAFSTSKFDRLSFGRCLSVGFFLFEDHRDRSGPGPRVLVTWRIWRINRLRSW